MAIKMSLLFLPIIVVMFITDEVTFNSMEQSIYGETVGSSIESLESVAVYLDGDMSNFSNVFFALNKDPALKNYVAYYSNTVYVSGRGVDIETELTNQLRTFSSALPAVNSLGVITPQYRIKQFVIRDTPELTLAISRFVRSEPELSAPDILPLNEYGSDCLLYVYPASNGPLSYAMFVVLNADYFKTLLENCGRNNVDYFILDGERVLYSSDPERTDSSEVLQAVANAAEQAPRAGQEPDTEYVRSVRVSEIGDGTYVVSSIPSMGWTIVSSQANPYPYNALSAAHRVSILSRLAMIVLTVALFLVFIVGFTRRLNEINRTMERIENGDLDSRFSPVYSDEISKLGEHLNNMVSRIREQASELGDKQMQVKEAQLRSLQNQINPHFLYNALEHIRMQAIDGENTQIADQVKIMGDMLRYNIQNDFGTVTVRQEFDQVMRYLAMQKYLLIDRLNVIIDTDESAMDRKVIKFLLQPLVENAIIHGISSKLSPSDLLVRIKDDGDRIDFEISDTGSGIEPAALAQIHALLSSARQPETPSGSVGLRNVNDRLLLFYGKDSALQIDSRFGVGTTISFSIPVAPEEESC